MGAALTAPFVTAAGLLIVSGLAKLRSPHAAAGALIAAGLPVAGRPRAVPGLVRAAALAELALGLAALLAGGRALALGLAVAYAGFAVLAWRLAGRRAACGCFGAQEAPATRAQALMSLALAGAAALAAAWPAGTLGWVLGRPAAQAATLALALCACVYGAVIAYTQLPAAWAAWSGR